MTSKEVKELVFSESILPGKIVRAAIYARASTDKDEQKDSCENQIFLAESFVKKHPNIEVVDTLIDDGISGKNAVSRPDFVKLLNLIKEQKIDLLITKSRSRLHRDDEVSIFLRNMCEEYNVYIYVIDKNTLTDYENDDAAFLERIEDTFDAQYVKRQSRYGKMTHQIRCEKKELSSKDICFGYDWHSDTKTITVNEAEAEVVKRIFEMYVFEQKKPADIAKSLRAEDVENRFSKVHFNSGTINRIIKNEKYLGNFYINRRYSKLGTGMNRKSKRIAIPKEEWVLCERPNLRIIDDELFELAQRLRASRQTIYNTNDYHITRQKFEGKHLFAGKIKCGCCGASLNFRYANRAETIPVYRVNSHSHCENKDCRIKESDASEIVASSIKAVFEAENDAISRVEHLLYENLHKNENEGELRQIERNITHLNEEIAANSRPLTDPDILANKMLKDTFLSKIKEAQDRIASLEARKKELSVSMDTSAIEERISHLRSAIAEFKEVKELSRERILRNVKEIVMNADGSVSITLSSGISFKRSVDKYQIQDAPC